MFRVSASKKSNAARGVEQYSVSIPFTSQEKYMTAYQEFLKFIGNNFENMLSYTVEYKKDS